MAYSFHDDFLARINTSHVTQAVDLDFEIVDTWGPSIDPTVRNLASLGEKLMNVTPVTRRWEKRNGVVAVGRCTVEITNATRWAYSGAGDVGKWARVYFGYSDLGRWYPYFHGIIRRIIPTDRRTVKIVMEDPIRLLLDHVTKETNAWFTTGDDYDHRSSRENPDNGNFVYGRKPWVVKGQWDYQSGPHSHEGQAGGGCYPHPTFRSGWTVPDTCVVEFISTTNFKYWFQSDPARVYDNGGPGYSRNSDILFTKWDGVANQSVFTVYLNGWDDTLAFGGGVSKIAIGDQYHIYHDGQKTGSGILATDRFNPVEVIREIVQDIIGAVRPPLTYGLDGADEGIGEVSLIDTSSGGLWDVASDDADASSLTIKGAWPPQTEALDMIQDALKAAMGSIWSNPAGGLDITIVSPLEAGQVTLMGDPNTTPRRNILSLVPKEDDTLKILRVVVQYRARFSGEEQEVTVDESTASELEKQRHTFIVPTGWWLTEAQAEHIANIWLSRRQDAPTEYDAVTTCERVMETDIFDSALIIDSAAGVFAQQGRVTSVRFDPIRMKVQLKASYEPELEGTKYARIDVDDWDDAVKVIW
jgi:hypothetical protein